MTLLDIVRRQATPTPWAEGEKIPWHDPDFSKRMLREHLSQKHDAASRRFEMIEKHVEWIHQKVLTGNLTKILDLGCGPGLYTSRLAKVGHECIGIDFSPASIAYAREQAEKEKLLCTYIEHDIRAADYGAGYGLVMLIFGELNVFRLTDAHAILRKAYDALSDNGLLLLEPHTFSSVLSIGKESPSWYSAKSGLFSDRPYICLTENFWDDEGRVATERYFIVDTSTGHVTPYATSIQAYTHEQYQSLLTECRFGEVEFHPSLSGSTEDAQDDFLVILSRK